MSDYIYTRDFQNKPCIPERQETYVGSYANNDHFRPTSLENQHCWHPDAMLSTAVSRDICCFCGNGSLVTAKLDISRHGEHHPLRKHDDGPV